MIWEIAWIILSLPKICFHTIILYSDKGKNIYISKMIRRLCIGQYYRQEILRPAEPIFMQLQSYFSTYLNVIKCHSSAETCIISSRLNKLSICIKICSMKVPGGGAARRKLQVAPLISARPDGSAVKWLNAWRPALRQLGKIQHV